MINWDAVGAVSEIVGAAAVVVTLLYLAKQISLTHGQTKTAGARELHAQYAEFYTLVATDPEISSLVTRLRDPNYVAQSDEEDERIESFTILLLGIWMTTAIAYEEGQIDINQYEVYKDDVDVKLTKWPGMLPYATKILERYPATKAFEIFKGLQD